MKNPHFDAVALPDLPRDQPREQPSRCPRPRGRTGYVPWRSRPHKARCPFALFGYCLMSNHFHLLLKPAPGQSISRILQSLTVAHTWRHHRRQGGPRGQTDLEFFPRGPRGQTDLRCSGSERFSSTFGDCSNATGRRGLDSHRQGSEIGHKPNRG